MGHETAVKKEERRGEKEVFLCARVKDLQTTSAIKSGSGKWG